MTPINAALIGIGGFALGVVVTTIVEIRKPDDVTVLVTDRDHLDDLDRIVGETDD